MCRISVTCCCHQRSGSGGLAVLAVGALLALAAAPVIVAAVHAAVDLITAVIIGIVVAAGVVVLGWIVKTITVAVIEERSLRRHNEHMAQRYPHLRDQLPSPPRRRAQAERVHMPAALDVRPPVPAVPVRIYPTPRPQINTGQGRRAA